MVLNRVYKYLLFQLLGFHGIHIGRLCWNVAIDICLPGFEDLHEVVIESFLERCIGFKIKLSDLGHVVIHLGGLERGALSTRVFSNGVHLASPEV